MGKLEEVLKKQTELDALKAEAIAELEAIIADAQEKLDQLTGGIKTAPKSKPVQRILDPNKPCSVCNFLTEPNHDARKHRSQGDNKKPFTAKELEELGLKKRA